ncbi:hypothetical protein [Stenotrophomonas maltophilia]|uniref:hypothetical protein n=1 Tax=Stenotrophomonas maltophilia TaxID=40324 RepID=UPI0015F1FEDA|nr:hypothetical protein [Stenotrophomonas maltophilia]QDY48762.1 hypothetical protein DUW70_09560 [Stenotrophomonas maltophilia]
MNGNEFVYQAKTSWATDGEATSVVREGLTKRELFAAMAMQGFASDPDATGLEMLAESAVDWADALLAALEKSK